MFYQFTPNADITPLQLATLFNKVVGGLTWNAHVEPLPDDLMGQFVAVEPEQVPGG